MGPWDPGTWTPHLPSPHPTSVPQSFCEVFKDPTVTSVTYVELEVEPRTRLRGGRGKDVIVNLKVGYTEDSSRPTSHRSNRNPWTLALSDNFVATETIIVEVLREGKRGCDRATNAGRKSEVSY